MATAPASSGGTRIETSVMGLHAQSRSEATTTRNNERERTKKYLSIAYPVIAVLALYFTIESLREPTTYSPVHQQQTISAQGGIALAPVNKQVIVMDDLRQVGTFEKFVPSYSFLAVRNYGGFCYDMESSDKLAVPNGALRWWESANARIWDIYDSSDHTRGRAWVGVDSPANAGFKVRVTIRACS